MRRGDRLEARHHRRGGDRRPQGRPGRRQVRACRRAGRGERAARRRVHRPARGDAAAPRAGRPPALDREQPDSLRSVLDPVADRIGGGMGPLSGAVGAAGGALLAVEVGAISGLLGQRVLGQYEFPILEPEAPARLLFVSPNLAQAAINLEADSRRAAALGRAPRDHARAAVRRRAVAAPAPRRDGGRAARRARRRPEAGAQPARTSAISRGSWRRCARATWRR